MLTVRVGFCVSWKKDMVTCLSKGSRVRMGMVGCCESR